jgi:hypothetical protein
VSSRENALPHTRSAGAHTPSSGAAAAVLATQLVAIESPSVQQEATDVIEGKIVSQISVKKRTDSIEERTGSAQASTRVNAAELPSEPQETTTDAAERKDFSEEENDRDEGFGYGDSFNQPAVPTIESTAAAYLMSEVEELR